MEVTDDGWFTEQVKRCQDMTREELLREVRMLAFGLHRRAVLAEAYRTGSDYLLADLRRRLGRAWRLLSRDKKTVKMDDLRAALDIEWAEEQAYLAACRERAWS
jgi:hypothetical protein